MNNGGLNSNTLSKTLFGQSRFLAQVKWSNVGAEANWDAERWSLAMLLRLGVWAVLAFIWRVAGRILPIVGGGLDGEGRQDEEEEVNCGRLGCTCARKGASTSSSVLVGRPRVAVGCEEVATRRKILGLGNIAGVIQH